MLSLKSDAFSFQLCQLSGMPGKQCYRITRKKGIASRREGVILLKRSDSSDKERSSRTIITGQSGKLPREGMISKERDAAAAGTGSGAGKQSFFGKIAARAGSIVAGIRSAISESGSSDRRKFAENRSSEGSNDQNAYHKTEKGNTDDTPDKQAGYARKSVKTKTIAVAALVVAAVLVIGIPVAAIVNSASDDSQDSDNKQENTIVELAEGAYRIADTEENDEADSAGSDSTVRISLSGNSSKDDETTGADENPEDTADQEDTEKTDKQADTETETDGIKPSETSGEEQTEEVITEPEYTVIFNIYGGDNVVVKTKEATVEQIMADNGIWLDYNQSIDVSYDMVVTYDCTIQVMLTEYAEVTESETVYYQTITYDDPSAAYGTSTVVTEGSNGSKDIVYSVRYVNGVEVERTYSYEYVTVEPVNEVISVGTAGTVTASDGTVYTYSKALTVRVTYYNLPGNTATGVPVSNAVCAVDPSVIPLGSKLYIAGETLEVGVRTATDTGVYGNCVDIWLDESSPLYPYFSTTGVFTMTAYILN